MNAHQRRTVKRVAAIERRAQEMGISREEFAQGLKHMAMKEAITLFGVSLVPLLVPVKAAVDHLQEVIAENPDLFFRGRRQ